ncbi:MAG: HEAT repeat domain-containing protein [Nitrospira sp.]
MESTQSFEEGTPIVPFVKEGVDPEVTAVKQLLKLLDKAAKSARTYGTKNPVAQRFFQQFYDELTQHLEHHARLAFLVQRNQLFFRDEVVYEPERDATGDSFAFTMYSDGIRELTFHQGLTQADLSFFLDALWGTSSRDTGSEEEQSDEDDDDIVTRLWAKNLSTITLVTAEELVRSSGFGADELELQTQGYMNLSVTSLRELLDGERARMSGNKDRSGGSPGSEGNGLPEGVSGATGTGTARNQRFQASVVGYEVSQPELDALTQEIKAETGRDATLYILDVFTAVLASEQSAAVLTKLFEVWDGVLDVLLRNGQWTVLETVLTLLQDVEAVRPDLSEPHKRQVVGLFEELASPERLKAIGTYLNRTPHAKAEGLLTLLLMMSKETVPGLCALLAALEGPMHQAIVMEALQTIAKDNADPIVRGLTDKRPVYVKNLLTLITRWHDSRFADAVEKALRHPEAAVRRDALRLLAMLRPSGNGSKLVALLGDGDETVRLTAMKVLASGQFSATFSVWAPFVTADEFHDRSSAEKRAIYLAMKQTTVDEAVPYWQGLLTEWSWTNRKKKEELALLAADMLGKLATPAAIAALVLGQKKGGTAVRQACTTALSVASRQHRQHTPSAANS